MANNFGGGSFSQIDYDGEVSTFSFNTAAITAVSLPGTLTQFGDLRTAIEGITLGTLAAETLYVNRSKLSNVRPNNENAQRERRWIITYEDVTQFFDPPVNAIPNAGFGKLFTVELGCADYEGRLLTNTADADLTEGTIAAFITAFEALARSPYGGQVNIVRIQAGGRNL